MPYYPDHFIRLSTLFAVDGVPTDPDTVTVTLAGDGVSTTYVYETDAEVIRTGAGAYHADLQLSAAGVFAWRWEGTGAAANPDQGTVTVEPGIARIPYASVDDVKVARRGLPDVLDGLVASLLPRASAAIDDHVGRRFNLDLTATDRWFLLPASSVSREVLIDDLADTPTEAALVDASGGDTATLTVASDLVLLPRNRPGDRPIDMVRLRPSVGWGWELRLKGVWGWPSVPDAVREATITTVSDWVKDGQGLTPQSPNLLEPGAPPYRGLPQKARDLLRPYRRIGIG